jgi:cobyrinic acid a,c-diamide synthase
MTRRLQNFGYVESRFEEDTVLGPAGTKIRAHEFHHSRLNGDMSSAVLSIRKNEKKCWPGGLKRKNVLAAYPHLHFYANPAAPAYFVAKCREYGRQKK